MIDLRPTAQLCGVLHRARALLAFACLTLSLATLAASHGIAQTLDPSEPAQRLAQARKTADLPTLTRDEILTSLADGTAKTVAKGGQPAPLGDRLREAGIGGAASERVLIGARDQAAALDLWLREAEEGEGVLSADFALFGLGSAEGSKGRAFVLLLSAAKPDFLADDPPGSATTVDGTEPLNARRHTEGLSKLEADPDLAELARQHALTMAERQTMGHAVGTPFAERMKAGGVPGPAYENLAVGQTAVEEVMTGWMNSPGHRRNMLTDDVNRFGLAVAKGKDIRLYWTLILAR